MYEDERDAAYNAACLMRERVRDPEGFRRAAQAFEAFGNYRYASWLATDCRKSALQLENNYRTAERLAAKKRYYEAVEKLDLCRGWEAADELRKYCQEQARAGKSRSNKGLFDDIIDEFKDLF